MGKKYIRQDGESMPEFQTRCRHEQEAIGQGRFHQTVVQRRRRAKSNYNVEQRNADRIDGYDRDDLGLSPDF